MLHLLGPASRGHVGPKGMFRSVRVWVSSWPCEGFFTSEFKQTYALSLCRTQKGMQYVQTMRSIVVCRPQETHLKPTSLPKFSYECMSFHPSSKLTQLRPIRCYFVLKIPCWSRLEWPLSGNCPKSVSRKSDLDRDFAPLKGKRTRIYIYRDRLVDTGWTLWNKLFHIYMYIDFTVWSQSQQFLCRTLSSQTTQQQSARSKCDEAV